MANEILKVAIGGTILAGLFFFTKESGIADTLKNNFDSLVSSFSGDSSSTPRQEKPEINSNPNGEKTANQTIPLAFSQTEQVETVVVLDENDSTLQNISNTVPKTLKNTKSSIPVITNNNTTKKVQTGLDTEQVFVGGGESFISGTIRETPIENLSLNQITKKLGVSASKAASLRAEARGETKGFDFGTNTGTGQKISTTNKGGESVSTVNNRVRVSDDAKRREIERATKIFDAGSIRNF